MLPEVMLKSVSRDDVDRIAWWLQDDDLSSRWFGRYGVDDPVHPGYDPRHMLEASDWEWRRAFGDTRRAIYSIYNTAEEHVGECQVQLDGEGGAELSVLIGRKDLWHHGFGTATMLELLDRVFNTMGLESAWVTVPVQNRPAIGLFEKLGFVIASGDHVKHGEIDVAHMTVSSDRYSARDSRAQKEQELTPVVAIAGLQGSESEALGQEVARLLDSEFIGDEIKDLLSERLQCSRAELESFETSHKSFWMRLLASVVVPTEVTTAYESGYHAYVPNR
ncbi:MAG: GNAT family protein, partial [Chloroflexi bacterium]|nr:GNAT family protein [Chloroflexota bacterium]